VDAIWATKQIVLAPENLMDIPMDLLIGWSEMISPAKIAKPNVRSKRSMSAGFPRPGSDTGKRNSDTYIC
jgi:hypothetical protein